MEERKITRETMVAETKLRTFDKRIEANNDRRDAQNKAVLSDRAEYIKSLPDDVRSMLAAGGVIAKFEAADPET